MIYLLPVNLITGSCLVVINFVNQIYGDIYRKWKHSTLGVTTPEFAFYDGTSKNKIRVFPSVMNILNVIHTYQADFSSSFHFWLCLEVILSNPRCPVKAYRRNFEKYWERQDVSENISQPLKSHSSMRLWGGNGVYLLTLNRCPETISLF